MARNKLRPTVVASRVLLQKGGTGGSNMVRGGVLGLIHGLISAEFSGP